jgi:hypothetical protein
MMPELISYTEAVNLFRLDPITGNLYRRYRGAESLIQATTPNGYIVCMVRRKQYQAHRIAWLLTHGKWPDHHIDHINGIKTDNRPFNLRDVPQAINNQNTRKARGYSEIKGRYVVTVGLDKTQNYIGSYETSAQARAAYIAAKRAMHAGNTL